MERESLKHRKEDARKEIVSSSSSLLLHRLSTKSSPEDIVFPFPSLQDRHEWP